MLQLAAMREVRDQEREAGAVDRGLRVFADVRAGEGARAVLMLVNIFVVLVAYYLIKTVREPLILAGNVEREWIQGSELKAYAAGAQALVLVFAVPIYAQLAARVDTRKLILGIVVFFVVCIELFVLGVRAKVSLVGFGFYVWVGIFSVALIALFWSFANDTYSVGAGERLFPLIAVGATLGAPVGAFVAGKLFDVGFLPSTLLHLAAALLVVHGLLYALILRRPGVCLVPPSGDAPGGSLLAGFALIARSRYLMLIAALLVVLNLVNTTGEYLLSTVAEQQADLAVAAALAVDPSASAHQVRVQFFGSFYGGFFFWVNVTAVLLQAFVVSRLVKVAGIFGVLLVLPVIALGTYGLVAAGFGFAAFRTFKALENATDYSVMNTAKALLWLPTTHGEKYQAKFATDTFFVRFGDVLAAALVYTGLHWLSFTPAHFAQVNVALVAIWLAITWGTGSAFRRQTKTTS